MLYQTFDIVCDADARYMDAYCIMNPAHIDTVILIQIIESGNDYDTCALCLDVSHSKAILVRSGNLSFQSTGGGATAANEFRRWLDQHGITRRLSGYLKETDYKAMVAQKKAALETITLSREFYPGNPTFESRFRKWVAGDAEW